MTRRYIAAGVGALVVVLLFYLVILKPKSSQISEVKTQITSAQGETQTLRIKLRQLQAAQRNQVETLASLAELNRALPPTPDLPSMIRQLQRAATDSGMDLTSIAPSPPVNLSNSTGVQTIDVNLQVMGGFFRLESFLTRLEDLGRVLEVSSMAVAPQTDPETGLMTLASTITFKMYVVQADAHVTGKAAVVPPSKATPSATPTPTPATTPTPTPTSS